MPAPRMAGVIYRLTYGRVDVTFDRIGATWVPRDYELENLDDPGRAERWVDLFNEVDWDEIATLDQLEDELIRLVDESR